MHNTETLQVFLKKQIYMVIAVALSDGTPWAVPVRIQHHEKNVFEWSSKLDTEHSKALEHNASMSVVLYEKPSPDQQFSLYMKGKGSLLSSENDMGRYQFIADAAWINDETFRKREVTLS